MSDVLGGLLGQAPDTSGRLLGVVSAVVTNNDDPEHLGRVKLRFPWLAATDGELESGWARLAVAMAGPGRGTWSVPAVDDEVLVAFEHGDVRFPYVLGSLWNGAAKFGEAPLTQQLIKTASGALVRIEDKEGEERIEVIDSTTKNKIVITAKENTIVIEAEGDIAVSSTGGKVAIKGKQIEIAAEQGATLKGQSVELTADQAATVKGATAELSSDGTTTVKGTQVKIN
jgi:uncharacterized protein involved in type VI secretion and phage assembly